MNAVAELEQARARVSHLESQAREQVEAEEQKAREQALERASKEMRSTVYAYHKARAELLPHLTALADLADKLVRRRQRLRRCSWQADKLCGDLGVVPPRLLAQDPKVRSLLDRARAALQAVGGS